MKRHVYLTGFMGAGKSRICRELKAKFSWSFYDSDELIEVKAGRSIKEIFDQDGEAAFRQMESECIRSLSENPIPAIIALGGGALMDENSLQIIKDSGVLVYIKSSPEAIFERVKNSKKRPLLKLAENETMLERIQNLLAERSAVYEKADIVFERDGLSLEEIVQNLYKEINRHWQKFRLDL